MSSHSRIRVLFVIGSMGGGGAERQILEILRRLDRSRFEPFLYLAMKQGELLGEVPSDVPVFAFWDGSPETWTRQFFRRLKLTQCLRHIHLARVLHNQKIDVIYDRTYLATLDAAGGCAFRPTPRISCCVADPGPELEMHSRLSISFSKWYARRAYRTASVVLANSAGLRQRVLDYFRLAPDHVHVLYNLLTAERHTESIEQDSETAVCDSTRAPFLIVTAGRLHFQKGHRFLLEAVNELVHQRGRTLNLVIFGDGESKDELREYVRSHGLETYVTLAGFVAEPRNWYAKASLFVLPSLNEGMPNALIEAIACGVPALSTDCRSGPSEILDGGRCGRLVPVGDATAIADGIADAMDHPEEWRSRAELARKRVEEMFDPDIGILRIEKLLETVATRQPMVFERRE